MTSMRPREQRGASRRGARTALLALALTTTASAAALTPAHAGVRADRDSPPPVSAESRPGGGHRATQAALRQLVEAGGLPGVAAEARNGRDAWFGSAGFADTGTRRERSHGDHFRAASLTKVYIATVFLQLADEGRLSLDDTVERWLPGVVRGNGNDGSRITLRQLLNHTSGLFSHTSDPALQVNSSGSGFPEHRYDTHTPEELVAVAMKHPPVSDPGGNAQYSNTNYVLAGMVIERVTGRPYAREATRRIIKPLNLRGTSFPGTSPVMPAPHPVGYSRLHDASPDARTIDATEQNMTWLGASGDLITTVGDTNRFHRALLQGKLLSRARMAEMLDEVPSGDGFGFGLGLEFTTLSCGVPVVGKTGRTNGSLSAAVATKDGRHQLTFNINGDWLPDGSLYVNVIEAEFCGKVPAPDGKTASGPPPGTVGLPAGRAS